MEDGFPQCDCKQIYVFTTWVVQVHILVVQHLTTHPTIVYALLGTKWIHHWKQKPNGSQIHPCNWTCRQPTDLIFLCLWRHWILIRGHKNNNIHNVIFFFQQKSYYYKLTGTYIWTHSKSADIWFHCGTVNSSSGCCSLAQGEEAAAQNVTLFNDNTNWTAFWQDLV